MSESELDLLNDLDEGDCFSEDELAADTNKPKQPEKRRKVTKPEDPQSQVSKASSTHRPTRTSIR